MGVSRHHCSIVRCDGGFAIVDKGSNNGTYLNGSQVDQQVLKHEDRIVLGKYSLIFDAHGKASESGGHSAAGANAGMGAEMTMFVDPEAIKQMQAKIKEEGAALRFVLAVNQGGHESQLPLLEREAVIGRGADADLPIKGMLIKPVQARLMHSDKGYRLMSLGGWRAVRVNGRKVSEALLHDGDVITIAGTTITFKKA
jgi:pSer/pThr/pTyr-binding forkhead associated (FHA) protein